MSPRAATAPERTACQQAQATAVESTVCMLAAFQRFGRPASLLDVGCGDGHLVRAASALGVRAAGCDIALPGDYIGFGGYALQRADLAAGTWRPPFQADMVLCLEVAEHLPPEAAGELVATLDLCLGPQGRLLFSAATPGQGGSGHVNERPHDYWAEMLATCGLVLDREGTDALRWVWGELAPAAWWYGKNILVMGRAS